MRAALILILIFILLLPSPGFGVPIESVPEPDMHAGDSVTAATAPSPPSPKIPDSQVEMFIRDGTDTRFELFFLDVRYGYDLVDFEIYKAWCLAENRPIRRNAIHKVRLYNCYDPNLPPEFRGMEWNQINYIVNHKKGSKEVIQQAIWYFANSENQTKLSVEATQLVEEANLKGKDYIPAEGDLIAIICQNEGNKQPVFLEYIIPAAVVITEAPVIGAPPVIPPAAGFYIPPWLALIPLIPIIPFIIPPGPTPPPPPSPPVPEPSSLLLLASGMAGILISRTVRKRIKKPYRLLQKGGLGL
ncbi:MAG: PEP-CTERM sorting domain-containing protein [Syntrophobacteraceae bacterium]|jgi:hypothetical protein